jgi:hypothetical protein
VPDRGYARVDKVKRTYDALKDCGFRIASVRLFRDGSVDFGLAPDHDTATGTWDEFDFATFGKPRGGPTSGAS